MADIINVTDLPTSLQTGELVELMVAGANAKASRVAPCLGWTGTPVEQPAPTAEQLSEARLVLVGAVKRWAETGSGALQQQTAGPFGMIVDTRQRTGFNLWPSEIEQLQSICSTTETSTSAFSITPYGATSYHLPWCALMLGALYCSCGADIGDGVPLYEGGILSDDVY